MDLAHFNVNEEGVAYDVSDDIDFALSVLEEFPNDTVVSCLKQSPMFTTLFAQLKGA